MEKPRYLLLFISFICLFLVSLQLPKKPKESKSIPKIPEMQETIKHVESPVEKRGVASYYGEYWNGRTTANMEIYDCAKLTCASPYLDFNTLIKVTNLDNCKSIVVRVNDRGPFKMDSDGKAIFPLKPHPKRILDLSKASFSKIGDLKKGLLNIKYEIL